MSELRDKIRKIEIENRNTTLMKKKNHKVHEILNGRKFKKSFH